MTIEYTLNEGLERCIWVIENTKENPILVAVYGWPKSGKSYFINRLKAYFESINIDTLAHEGAPEVYTFEVIKERVKHFSDKRWIQIFHCGWDRNEKIFRGQDPNNLARLVLKRKLDLNIGMYNPNLYKKVIGTYDIIISNPDSKMRK